MDIIERLKQKKVIIFDGGLGTELARRGAEMGGLSNLKSPDAVEAVHREYSLAGSDVVLTNTFTMNRISIDAHGQDIDVEKVNLLGVELARKAAGKGCLVFGDIGPTGQLLEPYGNYTEEQFYDCYFEQAAILDSAGVDGLIVETITDLREGICALRACKEAASLPVILSLAFSTTDKGGRTVMGSTVADAAKAAEKYGAFAVGANCGDLDPEQMSQIASLYKEATVLPLIIQPNAGKPKLESGATIFDMQPDEYAEGVLRSIQNGASMVGGCCGTTPAHIKALADRIGDL